MTTTCDNKKMDETVEELAEQIDAKVVNCDDPFPGFVKGDTEYIWKNEEMEYSIIKSGNLRFLDFYYANEERFIIPDGIQILCSESFSGSDNLRSVVIPDSVTEIGDYAFARCFNLTDVQFQKREQNSDSPIKFGQGVFMSCTSLSKIAIGTTIGLSIEMFRGCERLETVELPESLGYIDIAAFRGCTSLKHIDLPSGLRKIEAYAFLDCTQLESIEFPELRFWGILPHAFQGCTALKNVFLPSCSSELGENAFEGCYNLKKVSVPSTLSIPKNAFEGCPEVTIEVRE